MWASGKETGNYHLGYGVSNPGFKLQGLGHRFLGLRSFGLGGYGLNG